MSTAKPPSCNWQAAAKFIHTSPSEDPQVVAEEMHEELEGLEADLAVIKMTENDSLRQPPGVVKKARVEQSALEDTLRKATEQVVVDHTLEEYRRLWKQFTTFCVSQEFFSNTDELEAIVKQSELPGTLPMQISLWIMDKCDEIDIYTNKPKPLSEARRSYPYAQKMRAAVSHKFGRELHQGVVPWTQNPLKPETYSGNPSLSFEVSQYMISLRRRKARGGEVVQSARAITEDTIRQLYEYNMNFRQDSYAGPSRKHKAAHPEEWAGRDIHIMLNAIYVLAFICLLRFDEVLRFEWHWLTFESCGDSTGAERLRVTIPYRKTHQTGGIAPFVLYHNKERPWLDPVEAISRWIACNERGSLTGFVFRKKVKSGRFSDSPSQQMSSESFLECFRNNMTDINLDPRMYGTHSFRRGGCQYLSTTLRWPIRKICDWGGWSDNQDTGTIFKYLLSWTDQAVEREDFFNPNKQTGDLCTACGRTCLCA